MAFACLFPFDSASDPNVWSGVLIPLSTPAAPADCGCVSSFPSSPTAWPDNTDDGHAGSMTTSSRRLARSPLLFNHASAHDTAFLLVHQFFPVRLAFPTPSGTQTDRRTFARPWRRVFVQSTPGICFRTRAPTSPCPWRLLDCLSDTGTTHEIAQRGARTASGTLRCGWRMLHRTHTTPPACCRSLAWSRVESMDDACGRPTRLPAGCCCCLTMGLLLWSRACCVSRASRAGWQCEKPLRKRSEEMDAMASDCLSSLNRDFNWQSEIG